ncbi:MAG: putative peptidoglycan glycosyltransferase FtsW [Patescibacteria group bacterium]
MNTKSLIWPAFILIVFGLAMISSAGIYPSQKNFGTNYYYLGHQFFFGFLPGLALFFAASRMDYKIWKKISLPLILGSVFFLFLVFAPGFGINLGGAKRWVNFFNLFSFQPAEILKLTLIIYLASWLEGRKFAAPLSGAIWGAQRPAGSTTAFTIIIFFIGILIAAQPDIGTLSIIIGIAISMFFASGAGFKHIVGILLLIAVAFALLIFFEPYRFDRVFVLLNPDFDVKGIGYHFNQSLIAIGKGGFLGSGFGKGEQKLGFLPEPVGDSIFAVIGEELGFIGMTAVLFMLLFFVTISLKIAKRAGNKFASLYAVGLASWVGIQSFINVASLSGLAPLTGIPLPFISYGGTALAVLMLGVGILANIARKA